MPAVSNITKVSDGPSEDAIVNLNWFANGSSTQAPATLLDVSTLDAPPGQVVKAVSIQSMWAVSHGDNNVNTGTNHGFYVLDSQNNPILALDSFTDSYIDFCAGGCCPGLPDSDVNTGANGDLRYAAGNYTNSWTNLTTMDSGSHFNITLRVRKIYEDA